ncbi:MAG: 4'-phosphopantetheinyl transferase superfamily protein [Chlamydiia bacterium]|nr:4'-phosphopantetheinyl transferase superfamily protein [Chlamydiia bacterium]
MQKSTNLSVGIDIIQNTRIRKIIDSNALHLFFSKSEILYCESKKNFLQSFSGTFAVKEAIIKCLKTKLVLKSIEISREHSGCPHVIINGVKDDSISISISHERYYSVAIAIKTL